MTTRISSDTTLAPELLVYRYIYWCRLVSYLQTCNFHRASTYAVLPERKSDGAAGYDLASDSSVVIVPARGKALISTGLQLQLPPGTYSGRNSGWKDIQRLKFLAGVYGRIAARSGLASRNSIDVGAGVIDSDYRYNVFSSWRVIYV